MGLFNVNGRPLQKPQKRPRLPLLLFLFVVYAGVKLIAIPTHHFSVHAAAKPILPILYPTGFNGDWTVPQRYHFTGNRVRRSGTELDLGDRYTHLPASLLTRFFPHELVAPSCLTQPAPVPGPPAKKPQPIREDWPGFYGAPWLAHINGNLIAILHVYAPRVAGKPVAAPRFQIYPAYNGEQTLPDFDATAPATFQRGSKAVLYRVFPNGPIRCVDLVVQNGENNGVGHLYFQRYNHYYEMDTIFKIVP